MNEKKRKVCVIGLGYVGLPLALAFGENIHTIGFDISKKRVLELKNFDINLEHSKRELKNLLLLILQVITKILRNVITIS